MKNFMIGMHGGYDYTKFRRDFRREFYGVEVCLFGTEQDVDNLMQEAENKGFNYGIHFPLRGWMSKFRDPQFLSLDRQVSRNSYNIIEQELKYIKMKGLKPKYILFHFPKPVILRGDFDLSRWRFDDKSEYRYEDEYSFLQFKEYSEEIFKWLSEQGDKYGFMPILEFDALNKYICDDDYIDQLLEKYNKIKLCLDFGRIHLQKSIEKSFSDINVIRRFGKYTEEIHLSNIKVGEKIEHPHYPVLPTLKENDGWAPIKEYLKVIREENPKVKVLFEHRSDLITDEELEICYQWINKNIY
ncbi:hypothetical protein [Clostridium cellulovorans]|uniref:Xylose isomerase domain-containing protein TIM barrel n=1 Tax=Clostridium cellulovorans (strain ATCC 35296 / DSM 3052 / OCM 3 / 743B) TaxID=573061 RepID=D9SNA3_CLOC7|nr:hypothetical protein [Clostridium cellulovorans]ADL53895.1 hypothetical protein Clocel_4234 [Clostridium cellulovorans 743B]